MSCNNAFRGRCLHWQTVSIDRLSTAMISRLRDDLASSGDLQFSILRTTNQTDSTIQTLRQSIDRAKKKLDRLTEAYLNAAISLEDFKRLRTPLDEEIASSQTAMKEAESFQPGVNTTKALKDAIHSTIQTLESDASIAQKYDALNSIVEHCTFDKENSLLSITYRISV